MITVPTTLVLGAGASAHLKFQTASTLRHDIIHAAKTCAKTLKLAGIDPQLVPAFIESFERSGQPSIDRFLELNSRYSEIGKALIALTLCPRENPRALFWHVNDTKVNNWYESLFQAMRVPKVEHFILNKISIITFNYDRSIEMYLATTIRHSYGLEMHEALELVESLKIYHVHGRLGSLTGKNSLEYGTTPMNEALAHCVKQIRIIHEDDENHKRDLKRLHAKLSESRRIIFIGFSYDEGNMAKLNWPKCVTSSPHVEGSWYGLSKHRAHFLQQKFSIEMPDYGNAHAHDFVNSIRPFESEPPQSDVFATVL